MTTNDQRPAIPEPLLDLITAYFTESKEPMHPMMRGIMEDLTETVVLDIGCGVGSLFCHGLLHHGLPQENLFSIDPSDANLRHDVYSRRNKVVASSEELPFKDDSFDVIYSKSITLNTPQLNYVRCLEEIARVLRPGGIYIADERFDQVPQLAREGAVPLQTPFYRSLIDNENITDHLGLSPVERINYFQSDAMGDGEFLWYAFSKPDDHHRAA
jgi:ubiquinone/menaquinone biosynthesis C-methylase UbiE